MVNLWWKRGELWWVDGRILGLKNTPRILDLFLKDSLFGNGGVRCYTSAHERETRYSDIECV
jgi:hypothetical protein